MPYRTNDIEIMQQATAALNRATGFKAKIEGGEVLLDDGKRLDGRIELTAQGQTHAFLVEVRPIDRFAQLVQIRNRFEPYIDQLLLVAPQITKEIAEKCQELNLQFIDTAGNAFLRMPGMYVLIKGQRADKPMMGYGPGKMRAGTPAHLRIIFALLCKPELLNAPYRVVNQAAGVALGNVGWLFANLEERGFAIGKAGKRKLLEFERLTQEWVVNFPIKLRPKLHPRRFRAQDPAWWKKINIAEYKAQWGGEVAAAKLTGYIKPEKLTIYLHAENARTNLTKLVVDHRLRPDPQGDIEVLDAFWDFKDETTIPETVPPLLVYADLMATLEPRNTETAKLIYERYIKPVDPKG